MKLMLAKARWSLGSDETCQAFCRVCEIDHLVTRNGSDMAQGVSGIHLEDQLHGGKKVRVALRKHVYRSNWE